MKRGIWSVFALALMLALAISAAPAASAHPAQVAQTPPAPAQAAVCAPDRPLSTAALKAHFIQKLGAEGKYLVAHMRHRYIPKHQCGGPIDPDVSMAGESLGQAAPGALTNAKATTNAKALGAGACCQLTNAAWGGYYIDETSAGTNTNGVQANFNAELVSCGCSMYSWVGIGGVNGTPNNLDQVGIVMRSDKHFAFWCAYNAGTKVCQETGSYNPTQLFNVSQGDNIFGFVARYGVGVWEFEVQDTTTGAYFETTYGFSPDHTTADWIVECSNTNCNSGAIPFFNDITFSDDYWYDSTGNPYGAIHDINDNYEILGIDEELSSSQWAEPGSVYNGGLSFTQYWQ